METSRTQEVGQSDVSKALGETPVSLCLLTYKRAPVLGRTIQSLLDQTHRNFELIVNDDCSPDNTREVVAEFMKRDPRVVYHRNPRNLRYSGNQNAAFVRAKHDYIAYVHDGDVYSPQMVERWLSALLRHPTAGFVFNAQNSLNEDGSVRRTYTHPYGDLIPGRVLFDSIVGEESVPIWGILMIRRRSLERVGLFDGRYPVLADVDMWLRMLLEFDVAYIREPLYGLWPREKGHQNLGVNWKIEREYEQISLINLRRRGLQDPKALEIMKPDVIRMLRVRQMLCMIAAVRRLKPSAIFRGVEHILRTRTRWKEIMERPLDVVPAAHE